MGPLSTPCPAEKLNDDDDDDFPLSDTIAGDSRLVRSYPAAGRSGFLRGGMPLEIHVEFDPKELGQVEERFRIEVKGGESVDLVLRGEGVLDENLL